MIAVPKLGYSQISHKYIVWKNKFRWSFRLVLKFSDSGVFERYCSSKIMTWNALKCFSNAGEQSTVISQHQNILTKTQCH